MKPALTALARMWEAAAALPSLSEGGKLPWLEPWLFSPKLWQAMTPTLSGLKTPDVSGKGDTLFTEVLVKLANQWWAGYFQLQQEWLARQGGFPLPVPPSQSASLDQEYFKNWLAAYERDWQPLFKLPQVGLTRVYQEKAASAADKFHLFLGALARFLSLLYLPLERSFLVMREKLAGPAEKGEVSEDFKDYYKMWIKILEGNYMTLLKSPEYLQTMKQALQAFQEFQVARQELLTDALGVMDIPTHQEMDALYQEIYLVKKRLKELTRLLEKQKTPI